MRTLWQIISDLFKCGWFVLNFVRKCVVNISLVALIVLVVAICLRVRDLKPKFEKGALVMDLAGTVVEKPQAKNKFRYLSRDLFGASRNPLQENSLFYLVDILREAKSDAHITGLVLSLKNFSGANQVSLQYIGKALSEFRDSGKPIYAIDDSYSQAQYFLASYANKIYLSPQGEVNLNGIATNNLYYKTFLNRLKINSHIFRVGTYKSAVEPFLRDNMSNEARKSDNRWVGQLWEHYLSTTAKNRKIQPKQFFPDTQKILDGFRAAKGNSARFALNNKWVDEVASRPEIDQALIKIFGWNSNTEMFNGISVYDYQPPTLKQTGEKIAIIFAEGTIKDGSETAGAIGSDTTVDQIRDARLDPDIKAILFRINSPGGSVSASEVIRAELASVRAAGKPVVVSMGGVAASGGYWISTPANYIMASASTLTGSIGIFGIINTVENFLGSIGIHTDGVSTSPLASVSKTKALPSVVSKIMQLRVENGYQNFIDLVAQSRHKTRAEVDKIAQGRVWIGSDAIRNGLIDQLGDFDDAVKKAAELAKLKKYQLCWYLYEPSFLELFLMQAASSITTWMPSWIELLLPIGNTQISDWLKVKHDLNFACRDSQNRYAFCFSCENNMR